MSGKIGRKFIAKNRRAQYEYDVLEHFEAGLSLVGSEVKSLRAGQVNIGDSYGDVYRGEVWLRNLHIGPYEHAGVQNVDPMRPRKLLLHRIEILRLSSRVAQRGLTLIPIALYLERGLVKVDLAIVKGRRRYDKRQAIRRREDERETKRMLRQRELRENNGK